MRKKAEADVIEEVKPVTNRKVDEIKEAKKETAYKLLNKFQVIREKYTEKQISTIQIIKYIASVYDIKVVDDKVVDIFNDTEIKIRKTKGEKEDV